MSYRVFWSPYAEERLESLLVNRAKTGETAAAAREIDRVLATYPIEFGESRFDTVRIGFVRPVAVQYDVLAEVQTVIVYDVWRIRPRRG